MEVTNPVGPVVHAGELADAVIAAAKVDNGDRLVMVRDRGSYMRVELDGECILRRESIEQALGRPFRMADLEVEMPSFAGRIETTSDYFRFYVERRAHTITQEAR